MYSSMIQLLKVINMVEKLLLKAYTLVHKELITSL